MAIRVELELQDGQFVSRMMHAGESVRQFNDNLLRSYPALRQFQGGVGSAFTAVERADKTTKGFLATLRDLSIVAGVVAMGLHKVEQMTGGLLGSIVKINSEFENMSVLMKAMSQSTDKLSVQEQVKALREEATKAPFSLHALQDAATKLKASGFDPLSGSLRSIEDAVAAVGGTDEKLNRVVLAITQMSGKGVIQMEELRQQLGEALPMATELMARSMGLTISELIEKIATGTVAAKPALQGLMLEMNRTFGGQAQMMMTTYSGQITRTTTLLQGLALKFGEMGAPSGANTFFGEIKNQLNDLNNFLASEFAGRIGDSLNAMLVEGVQGLRWMVDSLIELRSVIKDVGEAALWAFGIFMTGKAASSVMSMVQGAIAGYRAWGLEVQALSGKLAALNALQTAGALGASAQAAANTGWSARMRALAIGPQLPVQSSQYVTSAAAMSGMALAARGAATTVAFLGSTVLSLVPLLSLLGLGIYAAAEYFDLFGNKAKNAWQELEQFGATSMEQVNNAKGYLQALKDELKQLEEFKPARAAGNAATLVKDARIEELKKQIADIEGKMPGYEADAEKAMAERRKANMLKEVQEALDEKRREYVEFQRLEREAYEKDRADANAKKGDMVAVQEKYRAILLQTDMNFYNKQLDLLRAKSAELKEQMVGAKGEELKVLELVYADVSEKINNVLQQKQLMQDQGIGVKMLDDGGDPAKALEKGNTALQNMQEEAAGLKSQLSGASREAGELEERLRQGEYGPEENETVKKLIEDLRTGQAEVDALKEALDAMNEGQGLYDSTMAQIQNEYLDLVTKGMDPGEAYKIRAQAITDSLSPAGKAALAMQQIRDRTNETRDSVLSLGKAFVDKLFGQETNAGANTVIGLLDQMVKRVEQIISTINGARLPVSFQGGSSMGMSFTGPMLSSVSIQDAVKKGFLSLIGAAEGTDKGRGYNETLGYGKFTGGPVDLVNMSLREVLTLQKQMLAHPANDFNSSAVGRYQIVSKTLEGLIGKLGLSLDQKFSPELQDRLAIELAKGRGNNPNELRNEWEGLRRVSDADIAAALGNGVGNGGMVGPQKPYEIVVKGPNGEMLNMDQQVANINASMEKLYGARMDDFWKQNAQSMAELVAKSKDGTDALEKFNQQIREGFYGADKDPNSPRYEKMKQAVVELAEAEKKLKTQREADKDVDNGIEQNTKRIAAAARELEQVQAEADKNPYAKSKEALQEINDRYDDLVAKAKIAGGNDPKLYQNTVKQLEAQRIAEINLFNRRDVQSTLNTLKQKESALRNSLGTEKQQRAQALNAAIAEQQAYLNNFKGTEAQRQAVAAQVEKNIQLLRQQSAQQQTGVFQQQMTQWADLSTNLQQVMGNAFSSVADGLTDMLMGEKVDWKKILKGILKDLINTGIKGLMGSLMGGKGGAGGKMGGAKTAVGGGKGGMGKMTAGVKHTGGIVGVGGGSMRSISPAAFLGAPKFHTGGIIRGIGIGPDEVPIIARRGEGVFTPEQMRAMGSGGGGGPMAFTSNVTVNANGGSPEQNDDLAKKVAKEVEANMRGLVYNELRQQSRPGGMLNNGRRS